MNKEPARKYYDMKKSILTFLGEIRCDKGNPGDALIMEISPDDAMAYCARGYVRSSFGDFEGAVGDFSKAIEINPVYAEAYVTRGLAKIVLGDYGGAIRDSDIAIGLDPDYAEAHVIRGLARRNLFDYRGALRDLDRAIETISALFRKYYNSGFARSERGDYEGTINDFDKAIELYPKYADMHFIRGITNIALQNFYDVMEARPGYFFTYHDRDYREHTSSYSLAYFGRGLAKNHIHDYRGAIEDYSYSIRLCPDIPVVYHKRGLAKASIGDYRSAAQDFEKAIEIDAAWHSAAAIGFSYPELLHPGAKGMGIHP